MTHTPQHDVHPWDHIRPLWPPVRRNKRRNIPHFVYSPEVKLTFARVTFSEACPIKGPQEWTNRTVEQLKGAANCSSSDGKYSLCYFIVVVLQLNCGLAGMFVAVPRSHPVRHRQSVALHRTSDKLIAMAATCIQIKQKTNVPSFYRDLNLWPQAGNC
jgi:hypothetical protein